jgi:hypothetical protein
MKKNGMIFEEVQYLREFRIILCLKITILSILLFSLGHTVYQQIFYPDNITINETMVIYASHGFGILFISHLIFFTRLVTQVNAHGLFIRFIPFHFWTKEIDLKDVKHIEAKQYRPILEYGGWGIRMGWKKKAYNVYGNKGVELLLKNDKKLLIGSQRAEELAKAIKSILK